MADEPITLSVLARFHREVILPDIERVVGQAELRIRDEMHTLFDALAQRLDRLETEYQMIVAGMRRIEERLDRLEQRVALRSEVHDLKARVETLEAQIRELEARLED